MTMATQYLAPTTHRPPAAESTPNPSSWVRGPAWDLLLLGGGLGFLSLGVFGLYLLNDSYSDSALMLYGFLFGIPHLAATYYRVYLDRRELRAHRVLAIHTPIVLFILILQLVIYLPQEWQPLFFTVWFHWQWWHILRQQYGVARVYQRRQRTSRPELDYWIDLSAIYLIPIWGLANRSNQWWEAVRAGKPAPFLNGEMWMLPLDAVFVWILGVLSVGSAAVFLVRQLQLYRAGEFSLAKFLMILSGMATFGVSMTLIPDFKWGYLALSLWHAVQYIFFVWNYETRKYRAGVDPEAPVASWLVQPGRIWAYLLFLYVVTALIGGALESLKSEAQLLPLFVAVMLTLNLHHYLIDTFIWRVRKPKSSVQ